MRDKILFRNKWLSVVERELDNGIKWVFGHHEWCNGQGVVILPFKTNYVQVGNVLKPALNFLGRVEICPARSDKPALCVVAGGMDKEGETPAQTAVRELYEETGYKVRAKDLIDLGFVRPSKGTDTIIHLFAVDVTNLPRENPTGDGSLIEETATTKWVGRNEAVFSKDPLFATAVARLEVILHG